MSEINVYDTALIIVIVAWVIFIYLVIARRNVSSSDSGPRRFYRTPLRFEERASPANGPLRRGPRFRPLRFEEELIPDLTDVGQQLHAVMAASFQRRRLLSTSEYRAFKTIEDDMARARRGYRVFAQTSLGEVLTSPDENAFRSINSKRVDILIVDAGCWPVVTVEYQGAGHYQGTAAARDAIKKEALRKAGVRHVEVSESDSDEQIRSRVREQLRRQSPPAGSVSKL
jgi:hypothetical protein